MACPGVGPCLPWDLELTCLEDNGAVTGCVEGIVASPEQQATAILSASQVLWALTGRQFSVCEVTIRPCRRACPDFNEVLIHSQGKILPFTPFLIGGQWFNFACGCPSQCSCKELSEINLPYPACEVSEVKVDGVVLPDTAYRIDNFKKLVRTDGGRWPFCQDMALPDTEEGTWSVTITYGKEPPQLALDAASEMACEFLKARLGVNCRLPARLTNLTRQGVTLAITDPLEFFAQGRTGFYLADLAIITYNPNRLMRRPGVYSPDMPRWRVETG